MNGEDRHDMERERERKRESEGERETEKLLLSVRMSGERPTKRRMIEIEFEEE